MSLTIEDLKPKETKINVNGVELTAKPLRLSHALVLTQLGEIFQNPKNSSADDVKKAEKNVDELIGEIIPELKDIQLNMQTTIEIIAQLMNTVQPSDNAELNAKGVKFDSDPKAETTGL